MPLNVNAAKDIEGAFKALERAKANMGLWRIMFFVAACVLAGFHHWNWVAMLCAFYLAGSIGDGLFGVSVSIFTLCSVIVAGLDRSR